MEGFRAARMKLQYPESTWADGNLGDRPFEVKQEDWSAGGGSGRTLK